MIAPSAPTPSIASRSSIELTPPEAMTLARTAWTISRSASMFGPLSVPSRRMSVKMKFRHSEFGEFLREGDGIDVGLIEPAAGGELAVASVETDRELCHPSAWRRFRRDAVLRKAAVPRMTRLDAAIERRGDMRLSADSAAELDRDIDRVANAGDGVEIDRFARDRSRRDRRRESSSAPAVRPA